MSGYNYNDLQFLGHYNAAYRNENSHSYDQNKVDMPLTATNKQQSNTLASSSKIQKQKNPIKLTIIPTSNNNSYGNLGSLRNTPITPSSATLNLMNLGSGAYNNIYYNQAVQPPSKNDALSPIHSQRPQHPNLYHHHQRSSSSYLGSYSSFYSENASPVTANLPPLPMHVHTLSLSNSNNNLVNGRSHNNNVASLNNIVNQSISTDNSSDILSGPPSATTTITNNTNRGLSGSWYSPNQSPSNRSPAKVLHGQISNNSLSQFSQLQPPQQQQQQLPSRHQESFPDMNYVHQQNPVSSAYGTQTTSQRPLAFNSQLPTHYENDTNDSRLFLNQQQLVQQQQQQRQSQPQSQPQQQEQLPQRQQPQTQQFIPPSRAPAPIPYFANNSVRLQLPPGGHKRGQSISVFSRDNAYVPQFGLTNNNEYSHPAPQLPHYDFQQQPQNQQQQQQNHYNEQSQSMQVRHLDAPSIKKVNSREELTPIINGQSKYRRASLGLEQVSPLKALTVSIATSYSLCCPQFNYQLSRNPRRVLTKPSEPKLNNNYDNDNTDYILYVNDVLGTEESRKYLVLDILGHGSFGQVVKCQNLINKEIVAVKVIKSDPVCMHQSLNEVSILETINHKIDPLDKHHFLRLKDRFLHRRHLCIAFELLSSNLYELIKQNHFNGLDMGLIKSFSRQLLSSLIVLKTFKIIHCDLKPENILLVNPDSPDLKIIDFGSACDERQTVYTYIQSRFYRAPEIILGLPYTSAIDMWSFGCIVAELFLGLPLLPGNSQYNQLCRIVDIFGYPSTWMIEMGKNSMNFMEKVPAYPSSRAFANPTTNSQLVSNDDNSTAFYKYKLKSMEKYSKEFRLNEKPSTNYFKTSELDRIILDYQPKSLLEKSSSKRSSSINLSEKELSERLNLLHFIKGILNINPLERWTPQQAIAHPFVNDLQYDENWTPPGISNSSSSNNFSGFPNSSHLGNHGGRQRIANMHRRGQLSTSAINPSGSNRVSTGSYFANDNDLYLGVNGSNGMNNNNVAPYTGQSQSQQQQSQPLYKQKYSFTAEDAGNAGINSFKFPVQ